MEPSHASQSKYKYRPSLEELKSSKHGLYDPKKVYASQATARETAKIFDILNRIRFVETPPPEATVKSMIDVFPKTREVIEKPEPKYPSSK
jgi:hypothetical protein